MASIMQERRREHLNTPHLASASGSIASFQTDMRANLEEIKIHFNPVQSGTGTPSPTNVRPLSGWTGLNIRDDQKNLLEPTAQDVVGARVAVRYYFNGLIYLPAGTYTMSASEQAEGLYVRDENSTSLFLKYDSTFMTFTLTEGKRVYLQFYKSTSFASGTTYQLEIGSTATSYAPYVGNKIPVSWSEHGVEYGGWVNEKGEIWREWASYDARPLWWQTTSQSATRGVFFAEVPNRNVLYPSNIICNKYQTIAHNIGIASMDDYGIKGNQSATFASIIYIRDSRYTDITSFRQNIDAFFTYQLETPQLVGTISPIQLKTLVGQNNIWSNANGDVDVKYWKH